MSAQVRPERTIRALVARLRARGLLHADAAAARAETMQEITSGYRVTRASYALAESL